MLAIRGKWLVATMCAAEVLTMVGFSAWAVLLGPLRDGWGLSNAAAGVIGGAFFAGYTVAVPVLVSLTDRMGSRRVWLAGAGLTIAGTGGFALFATGLGSAAAFQALAGAGLAGTYMPGLRLLADGLPPQAQSRAVAFYTASFGVGTAASYLAAEQLALGIGWRAAFLVPAGTTALAVLPVLVWVPDTARRHVSGWLPGLGAVLRNRAAMPWSLAYVAHSWEIYTARSWVIAFLTAVAAQAGPGGGWPPPATVAFAMAVVGIFTIVLGNECSMRCGRRRTVIGLMAASAAVGAAVGLVRGAYGLTVGLVLVHGMLLTSESASVTAGALGNAVPGHRGTTLAVHSMLGFAGGAFGPAVFGLTLDMGGGAGMRTAWAGAYVVLAAVTLLGPLAVAVLRPRELPGDGGGRVG